MRIQIKSGDKTFRAKLKNTLTSKRLWQALPFESVAQTWGDEVYFSIPLESPLESDAQQVVEPGTVGFWVEGNCLAIPFGPTPISEGNECRLAARVNLLGQMEGDPKGLASVRSGDPIRVSRIPE